MKTTKTIVVFYLIGFLLFAPVYADVVSSTEYKITIGDILQINLGGGESFVKDVPVDDAGNIVLPIIGIVSADGKSIAVLKNELEIKLKDYIKNPGVTITVLKSSNICKITLMGQVEKPGDYPIQGRLSLDGLMNFAGGATIKADVKASKIIRNGEEIALDPEKIGKSTDVIRDLGFKTGDIVFVPERQIKVMVFGQVNKPGEFVIGDKDSLLGMIATAGGFTAYASLNNVKVIRGDKVLRVRAGDLINNAILRENIGLVGGDIVYVPKKFMPTFGEVTSALSFVSLTLNVVTSTVILSLYLQGLKK